VDAPGCIDICSVFYKKIYNKIITSCTCSVQGEYTIEDGIDGLAMREGILDEANVA
jgi:hypothetical protein